MTPTERIEAAIGGLISGNPLAFSQNIQAALMDKLVDRMDIEKVNIASQMFNADSTQQEPSEEQDA